MMERRTEESIAAFRRAVDLNPNSAAAHGDLSHGLAFAGQDREAIEHGEDAIRLSPLDPEMALFLGAHCGRALCRRSICGSCPVFRTEAAAVCARAFRARNACAARAWPRPGASMKPAFLATVRREQPQLSLDWIRASVPYQTPELMERFLDGMRKAGLND